MAPPLSAGRSGSVPVLWPVVLQPVCGHPRQQRRGGRPGGRSHPARPAGLRHPDRQRDGAQPPETGDWGIHCGVWLRRRGAQRHHGGEINRLFADHRCRYSCQSPRPAGELGATHQINGKEQDAVALIKQITGKGAHYAVETTGVSAIVLQAVHAVKPLGTVAIVGFTGISL